MQKITAKLAEQGKAITYAYDYNRLTGIQYPNYPANNVTYIYGAPNAAHNRAGRIIKVTHQAGYKERWYGKLGETTKELQAIDTGNSVEQFTTGYVYDSWGRLHALTYPDGEVLRYTYDAGGNVNHAEGEKGSTRLTYLRRLDYDTFGQRVFLEMGNGLTTQYNYDAKTRRLSQLRTNQVNGIALQNLHYGYDKVGNILSLDNNVLVPTRNNANGGPVKQTFGYDELYRLTSANGDYQYGSDKHYRYTLNMQYDGIHNITRKLQSSTHDRGGKVQTRSGGSYDWAYAYNGAQPHAPSHIGERAFSYDANGNQTGWQHDSKGARRTIEWDDENRIMSIADPGNTLSFVYDEAGTRLIKQGQQGKTIYANKFYVITGGASVSKHIYVGTTRLATQLLTGVKTDATVTTSTSTTSSSTTTASATSTTDTNANTTTTASTDSSVQMASRDTATATTTGNGNGKAKGKGKGNNKTTASASNSNGNKPETHPGQGIFHRSDRANEVAKNTTQNPNMTGEQPGGGNTGGNGGSNGSGGSGGKTLSEKYVFFYHPDHLGSTSYVTNDKGEVYEHIQYMPFGETWVEETAKGFKTDYLFTSKEIDTETGLYYYGARYYDPRTSVWQSADPILRVYIPGNGRNGSDLPSGGIFNPTNLALFTYSYSNPVKYLDPDGNKVEVGYTSVLPGVYHTLIIMTDDKTGETKVIEAFPSTKESAFVTSAASTGSGSSTSGSSASASGSASCASSCGSASGSSGSASGSGSSGSTAQGASGFGKLTKATASQQTKPDSPDIVHKQTIPTPDGMTDKEFRAKLEAQAAKYKNDKKYLPVPFNDRANSNSMVFDTLREVGAKVKPDKIAPGHDKSVYNKKKAKEKQ